MRIKPNLYVDQIDFVKRLAISLKENIRIIGCAATGYGKSKVMGYIGINAAEKSGFTVVYLTEAIKIFDQLDDEFKFDKINADTKDVKIKPGNIYLAMAQTMTRRQHLIEELALLGNKLLVITDEGHVGTTSNILRNFKDAGCFLLTFTATPDYWAAKHLPELYNDCVVACQVDELIQSGRLCTYKHYAKEKNTNLDLLKMRGADYSEASQEKAFGSEAVYDGLLSDLREHKFNKAMVFTASIKACEETYNKLLEAGFNVTRYHSGNKDYPLPNPDFELAKFTKLEICNVCVSVASLTKGFDFPPIDLICLFRKTKSLPLYLQMMGRASRVIKLEDLFKYKFMTEPKSSFIVLDYGGHWKDKRLGLYWDDRDWAEMWKEQPKKDKEGAGVSTIKACENCDELISVQSKVCPECGYVYPEIKKELEVGEMIEVTKSYSSIVGKWTSQLTPEELAVYAKIKNRKKHAQIVATVRDAAEPTFLKQYLEAMGEAWHRIQIAQRESIMSPINYYSDLQLR